MLLYNLFVPIKNELEALNGVINNIVNSLGVGFVVKNVRPLDNTVGVSSKSLLTTFLGWK